MTRKHAFTALALIFGLTFAARVLADHQWGCYRFPDPDIFFFNGATGEYHDIVQEEALTDPDCWDSTIIHLIEVGSGGTNDQINVFNDFYGETGWLGLATISPNGCIIRYGVARFNQTYLDNGSYTRDNKAHVVCQEIGHNFGLDHNRSANDTCMNDHILNAPHPNEHDREMLAQIYASPIPSPSPTPTPTPTPTPAINNARFISQSVPTEMIANQEYDASVTMENNGNTDWTSPDYQLGSQNEPNNTTWGFNRVPLPFSPVRPGDQVTFRFRPKAPPDPGDYNFRWRMVQDGAPDPWFGDRTNNVVIHVAACAPQPPAIFIDVPPHHWARPWIESVYHAGVSEICDDCEGHPLFCPESALRRRNAAVWLLKAREGAGYVPPPATGAFVDVPPSDGFAPWIEELAHRAVTAGCGGGRYCPDEALTRAQAAVFLLRTREGQAYVPPACTVPTFADVPCSSPFAAWIGELSRRGITTGCGNGNYCPEAPTTRAMMSVFISKTFNVGASDGDSTGLIAGGR